MFDAASGFGGYRESGYGREGGKEGLFEYIRSKNEIRKTKSKGTSASKPLKKTSISIDRTPKLYIGGKQTRPDQGYSVDVQNPKGEKIGEVGRGNRKDIRNAVEVAIAAQKPWVSLTSHARAQVIYYIAENLSARAEDFTALIAEQTGQDGRAEVEASIARIFATAAWADKYDGQVHGTAFKGITYTLNEPVGVIGVVAPDVPPLSGLISTVMPVIAMGNTVVVIPSEKHPLAATELYQVFDTSDLPGGVVNIVTGLREELERTLFEHDGIDGVWQFASEEGCTEMERLSAGNLKQTWAGFREDHDLVSSDWPGSKTFIRHATQVKNIWVPTGE
jgi:aldehyde dehydrogenase (NAD+)